jgi:hypothetical protein
MAEFCVQCSSNLGFEPDFVGLITEEEVLKGLGAVVLCEGCGPTIVDHKGRCIANDCLEKHGLKEQTHD